MVYDRRICGRGIGRRNFVRAVRGQVFGRAAAGGLQRQKVRRLGAAQGEHGPFARHAARFPHRAVLPRAGHLFFLCGAVGGLCGAFSHPPVYGHFLHRRSPCPQSAARAHGAGQPYPRAGFFRPACSGAGACIGRQCAVPPRLAAGRIGRPSALSAAGGASARLPRVPAAGERARKAIFIREKQALPRGGAQKNCAPRPASRSPLPAAAARPA